MTATSEFDLNSHALEVVQTSGTADVQANVDLLMERIPRQVYKALLRRLLYHTIINAQSRHRRSRHSEEEKPAPRQRKSPESNDSDSSKPPEPWHQQSASGWWRTCALHLGGNNSVLLEDATAADLRKAASIRWAMAAGNTAWAKRMESCADLIERHDVTRLGDLDDALVLPVWEGEQ